MWETSRTLERVALKLAGGLETLSVARSLLRFDLLAGVVNKVSLHIEVY